LPFNKKGFPLSKKGLSFNGKPLSLSKKAAVVAPRTAPTKMAHRHYGSASMRSSEPPRRAAEDQDLGAVELGVRHQRARFGSQLHALPPPPGTHGAGEAAGDLALAARIDVE